MTGCFAYCTYGQNGWSNASHKQSCQGQLHPGLRESPSASCFADPAAKACATQACRWLPPPYQGSGQAPAPAVRTRQQRHAGDERVIGHLHQRHGGPRRRGAGRGGHRDGNIRASSTAELQRAGGGGGGRRLPARQHLHVSHARHRQAAVPARPPPTNSAMPATESGRRSIPPPPPPPPACTGRPNPKMWVWPSGCP